MEELFYPNLTQGIDNALDSASSEGFAYLKNVCFDEIGNISTRKGSTVVVGELPSVTYVESLFSWYLSNSQKYLVVKADGTGKLLYKEASESSWSTSSETVGSPGKVRPVPFFGELFMGYQEGILNLRYLGNLTKNTNPPYGTIVASNLGVLAVAAGEATGFWTAGASSVKRYVFLTDPLTSGFSSKEFIPYYPSPKKTIVDSITNEMYAVKKVGSFTVDPSTNDVLNTVNIVSTTSVFTPDMIDWWIFNPTRKYGVVIKQYISPTTVEVQSIDTEHIPGVKVWDNDVVELYGWDSAFSPEDVGSFLGNGGNRIKEYISESKVIMEKKWEFVGQKGLYYVPELTQDRVEFGDILKLIGANYFECEYDVVAVKAYQDFFIAWDFENMYIIDPLSSFSKVLPGFGCVATGSVAVVDGILIWVGAEGVWAWTGEGQPKDLSLKIKNKVTGKALWELVNMANQSSFAAGVDEVEGKYYLSVGTLKTVSGAPASALVNAVLVCDIRKGGLWVVYSYPDQFIDFASYIDATNTKSLYALGATTKSVYKLNTGTTDWGTAIEAEIITNSRRVNKNSHITTEINTYTVEYLGEDVEVSESTDDSAFSEIASLSSTTRQYQIINPGVDNIGHRHAIKIEATGVFIFYGYGFIWENHGMNTNPSL